MSMPKVSVLIRAYNHADTIERAVLSVISQTFMDWELIIVDDCSMDATKEIVSKIIDPRIRYYRNEKNLGPIGNLNYGISLCRGEYISILDADDCYKNNKLELQVDFLDKNQDYGAVFSYIDINYNKKDKSSRNAYSWLNKLINNPSGTRAEMLRKFFFTGNFLAFPTEMFRKELAIEFPENLVAMGDCNFHIHVLLKTKIKVLEIPLVDYDVNDAGSHVSNWATHDSNSIEDIFVMENFIKIDDLELFKQTFHDELNDYEQISKEDIPFLIALTAIKNHKFSGKFYLAKLFSDNKTFNLMMNKFNLTYKNYVELKHFQPPSTKKKTSIIKKFKKKFFSLVKSFSLL